MDNNIKQFKPFVHSGVKDLTALLTNRGDNATHGDLIIVRCDTADFPKNFSTLPTASQGVLAEGEHTAHAHQLFLAAEPMRPAFTVIDGGKATNPARFQLRKSGAEMYLLIEGGDMLLKHQEHVPFRIAPGNYQVGIQVEYDPYEQARRNVLD